MTTEKLERIIITNKRYTFYNYLKLNRQIGKCVVLITDRQLVFLPAHRELDTDHWILSNLLLEAIGIDLNDEEKIQGIFLSAINNELTVQLPEKISLTQMALMNHIFADIENYRGELSAMFFPDGENIDEEFLDFQGVKFIFLEEGLNKDNFKAEMAKRLTEDKITPTETIIGITPTEEELERTLQESQNLLNAHKTIK